ncbi:MAG: cytochrome c maturation protein CcmE [Candidatus Paracaedibacteraceae bacterium]|nr:cytochrome c maturation protein CcmE [Candidatus Paracaedibacteraceae bacterium]
MTRTHERIVQIIAVLCIAIGVSLWLTTAFRENILFFVMPSELIKLPSTHPTKTGKRFRLGGLVAKHSIKKNGIDIIFALTDEHKGICSVHYRGIPPELFKESQGMVAEGFLNNNIFEAERLLAKHDERYMPKEIEKRLKKDKLWRK